MQIGILGVLGIVFIVLKLCGVIAWPWLWVLSPFWIGIAIWLFFVVLSLLTVVVRGPGARARRRY